MNSAEKVPKAGLFSGIWQRRPCKTAILWYCTHWMAAVTWHSGQYLHSEPQGSILANSAEQIRSGAILFFLPIGRRREFGLGDVPAAKMRCGGNSALKVWFTVWNASVIVSTGLFPQ